LYAAGLADPKTSYLLDLTVDALLAVRLARSLSEADPDGAPARILVRGGSQGGALALLAAALDPAAVRACLCDVPSGCRPDVRVLLGAGVYGRVRELLAAHPDRTDEVLRTLSYFDLVHLAPRIRCPVFASAGLADDVCPAGLFLQAYQRIPAPKQVILYPEAGHEGGGDRHELAQREWIDQWLAPQLAK